MATIKVLPSGAFQLRVVSKLLPKTLYATFDTKAQAVAYNDHLKQMLAKGIVPQSVLETKKEVRTAWSIHRCIAEYVRSESIPHSEVKLLDTIRERLLPSLATSDLNYDWSEAWVREMKRKDNLAPNTIRHRHGALARCLDWMCRRHADILTSNPLRLLKRGFATYTEEDRRATAANGLQAKVDIERGRRLEPEEEIRILNCLNASPDEKLLLILALETAMRMRECYTLSLDQISFPKKTIHLERTKNGDGREVPMSSTIIGFVRKYAKAHVKEIKARDGRLFPFWSGDLSVKSLDATTAELSVRFRTIFLAAKVVDFRFHDLRHEATCRLYEKTTLSDVLIARITGHRNLRMLQRYASLRGSDLAAHLW